MRSRSTIRLPATSTCRGASKSVQQAHRPGRAGQVGRAPDSEPHDGPRAWVIPKPAVRDVPSDPSRRITYCHEAWEGRQYPVPKTLPFRGGGLQQTTKPRSNPTSQSQSCSDKLVSKFRPRDAIVARNRVPKSCFPGTARQTAHTYMMFDTMGHS